MYDESDRHGQDMCSDPTLVLGTRRVPAGRDHPRDGGRCGGDQDPTSIDWFAILRHHDGIIQMLRDDEKNRGMYVDAYNRLQAEVPATYHERAASSRRKDWIMRRLQTSTAAYLGEVQPVVEGYVKFMRECMRPSEGSGGGATAAPDRILRGYQDWLDKFQDVARRFCPSRKFDPATASSHGTSRRNYHTYTHSPSDGHLIESPAPHINPATHPADMSGPRTARHLHQSKCQTCGGRRFHQMADYIVCTHCGHEVAVECVESEMERQSAAEEVLLRPPTVAEVEVEVGGEGAERHQDERSHGHGPGVKELAFATSSANAGPYQQFGHELVVRNRGGRRGDGVSAIPSDYAQSSGGSGVGSDGNPRAHKKSWGGGRYKYERRSHFRDTMNQFQGRQQKSFPPLLYHRLEEEFEAHHLCCPLPPGAAAWSVNQRRHYRYAKVTKAHILTFLAECKYSKYYEDVNLLHSYYTGTPCPDISNYESLLMEDFDKVVAVYERMNINRDNFLNSNSTLYQLLRRRGYPCKVSDFSILKTKDRIITHETIMADIFRLLNWKFYPLA